MFNQFKKKAREMDLAGRSELRDSDAGIKGKKWLAHLEKEITREEEQGVEAPLIRRATLKK